MIEHIKDLKDLTWNQALGIIFGYSGALSPGILIVYLFRPDLLIELETLKLILFTTALSMPIVIVNIAFSNYLTNDGDYFENAVGGLYLSTVVSYFALLFSYFLNLSFGEFLLCLLITQVVISGSLRLYVGKPPNQDKKPNN